MSPHTFYSTELFEIHPDITNASTLDAAFYTDERYFELSKEKIFARSWQFLGKAADLETLTPATILPGVLDEPVLLVKTDEGLRCLSNVCTHRGKVLVEAPCQADLIRCGYHGRRFGLDGKFLSMPEFVGVSDFPSEADDLRQVPIAVRRGFIFAAPEPRISFEDLVEEAAVRFADDHFEADGLCLSETRTYEIEAHWALYCENYLEGFHIPFVHKALN